MRLQPRANDSFVPLPDLDEVGAFVETTRKVGRGTRDA